MMKWRVSPGNGQASTEALPKLPWFQKQSVRIQPIGENRKPAKFVSRQPWSRLVPVVSRANQPDVSQLEIVLDEIVIERPDDIEQQLGGDNGYDGDPA